jgi:hypothetical protein
MLNGPRTFPNTPHHRVDDGVVLGRHLGLAGDRGDARHA